MKARASLVAALLLAVLAARAQEVTPPLAVRKDGLRPGWFFVGVVPGIGTDTPILIELRAGSENAPVRRFRSPHPRSFDLCAILRSAGVAGQAGPLYLLVSRGAASFHFSIPYNGKLCTAAPAPGDAVASTSAPPALAPLVLTMPPPASEPEPAAPAVAQATPVPTAPSAAAPSAASAAAPVAVAAAAPATSPQASPRPTTPAPAQQAAAPAAAPASTPAPAAPAAAVVAHAAAPATAQPAAAQPAEPAEAPGLSGADRGLTTENFDGLSAFLLTDKKLGTSDIRLVLRFKRPVNVDGVESVVFLKARLAKGRSYEFLDRGQENFLDPTDDPAHTLSISTTIPMGLALETAGVNHILTVQIQVGSDPALAVFEGRVGIKRGLEK